MVHKALLLAFVFRGLFLLLPQTFFQPDEFYQALEPAHRLVFGYGHLTWEWKDLPAAADEGWWGTLVAGGRMRSWLWPSVFAGVYKLLLLLKLDDTWLLTIAPRIVGVVIAALTDFATYLLAVKVLGPGSAAGALLLSLTSPFHAHLLPRALSTSPETLLTTLALVYFPLPLPIKPAAILVGDRERAAKSSSTKGATVTEKGRQSIDDGHTPNAVTFVDVRHLDYSVMDRMGAAVEADEPVKDNLSLSTVFASLSICIRPTTLPFWMFMGTELSFRTYQRKGAASAATQVAGAGIAALLTLAASTGVDYLLSGRLYFPLLTFAHQNLGSGISSFYGATNPFYHLVQSLPIMLLPIVWWWSQGFASALLPSRLLPRGLASLDRPEALRCLARGLTFGVATLSLSPHSECRFVHPFLPSLLLFALPPLFQAYVPTPLGVGQPSTALRQYCRIPKIPFYWCLFFPILPFIYLEGFHGRAQVGVLEALRRGEMGTVAGLVALMPCHSTPWMSHLHEDVNAWFLTCEPPIGIDPKEHHTQQAMFYDSPVAYLENVFPYPPVPLHEIFEVHVKPQQPSHVLLFGSLLEKRDSEASTTHTVREALQSLDYQEVWHGWNGFDFAQDEAERRGGVRVWTSQAHV